MREKTDKLVHQAQDSYNELSRLAKQGEWEMFGFHLGQLKALHMAAKALADNEFIQIAIDDYYEKFLRGFAGFAVKGNIEPPRWALSLVLDAYDDYKRNAALES